MNTSSVPDHAEDVLRALRRTRQIREFESTPVADDLVERILDVARWTGSAQNRQPWTFVVLRDPERRRRFAELAPQAKHVASAPVAIAIAMPGTAEVRDAYDEGRVSERILVAAEALGLGAGIGWVKASERDTVGDFLGITEPAFVRTVVSIGYPTAAARAPKSAPGTARRPLRELVRDERAG